MHNVKDKIDKIFKEMGKVIVGQEEVISHILVTVFCDANALIEGYPGLGKTTMIKTLADLMDLKFSRIQSTPDLMPTDITGTYILEESEGQRKFVFHKGPVFANIVLADEINRATPKTQSALLEAMQEKQVTAGKETFQLERPFFILATQNPIEQEGTYPLPEAQSDRFLLKIKTKYPNLEEESKIVDLYTGHSKKYDVQKVIDADEISKFQEYTRDVPIADDLKKFSLKIVVATRSDKDNIEYGASPRASIGIILASKAHALIKGRNHVSRKDIETMALPVLRHRIILNFEAERKGISTDDAIRKLMDRI